jgi:hypothetical protein
VKNFIPFLIFVRRDGSWYVVGFPMDLRFLALAKLCLFEDEEEDDIRLGEGERGRELELVELVLANSGVPTRLARSTIEGNALVGEENESLSLRS